MSELTDHQLSVAADELWKLVNVSLANELTIAVGAFVNRRTGELVENYVELRTHAGHIFVTVRYRGQIDRHRRRIRRRFRRALRLAGYTPR